MTRDEFEIVKAVKGLPDEEQYVQQVREQIDAVKSVSEEERLYYTSTIASLRETVRELSSRFGESLVKARGVKPDLREVVEQVEQSTLVMSRVLDRLTQITSYLEKVNSVADVEYDALTKLNAALDKLNL